MHDCAGADGVKFCCGFERSDWAGWTFCCERSDKKVISREIRNWSRRKINFSKGAQSALGCGGSDTNRRQLTRVKSCVKFQAKICSPDVESRLFTQAHKCEESRKDFDPVEFAAGKCESYISSSESQARFGDSFRALESVKGEKSFLRKPRCGRLWAFAVACESFSA